MWKTEQPLGPDFELRLRAALNRVHVPHGEPRYLSVTPGAVLQTAIGRALPVVAVALTGLLLTAYAATGTPNPVTWARNAASAITTMTHVPEPTTAPANSAPVQSPDRAESEPSSEPGSEQEPAETRSEPAETKEELRQPDPGRSSSAAEEK